MLNIKNHKTSYMFDPFGHLGPKRRKMLDGSWAGIFREHILTELPVHLLAKQLHIPEHSGHRFHVIPAMDSI